MKKLILFDFDGTLTTKDTMIEFVRFVRGNGRLVWGYVVLAPMLVAYKLGWLPNDRAKVRLLAHHLGGLSEEKLRRKAQEFAEEVIPGLLRPAGLAQLRAYVAAGDRVVLVSASLRLWLADWAGAEGIELVSTEALWEGGKFTGELATPNCHGPAKVHRIEALVDRSKYGRVVAYGDSSGDREMLDWADEGHYQPFRD